MSPQSWSPNENLSASRCINICCQCVSLLCLRADGAAFSVCCHTVLVTVTAKWVRMGGAALQQWSATLYGAKASYGVQNWFVGYTAVFFVTGPVCKFPT
jgi:hypothetical protein